jgi:hypothetical protein
MLPLASVGELDTHLQRETDPAAGQLAVALASGAVRAYCGWDLARETTTFHVTCDGSNLLTLPTLHLLAVDEIRGVGVVDPSQYSYSRKGQIWGCWKYGAEYEIDVVHGYEPIPDLIKLVTLDLASKRLTNPESLMSATVGQVSRTWETTNKTAMSTLHERLLDRYSL